MLMTLPPGDLDGHLDVLDVDAVAGGPFAVNFDLE